MARLFTGTIAECEERQALVDKGLGYPMRGGVSRGGGVHAPIQDTWDGTGPTPFGWIETHESVWDNGDGTGVYRLEDSVLDALTGAGGPLSATEKATLNGSRGRRSTVADRVAFADRAGGKRVKPRPDSPQAQIDTKR